MLESSLMQTLGVKRSVGYGIDILSACAGIEKLKRKKIFTVGQFLIAHCF